MASLKAGQKAVTRDGHWVENSVDNWADLSAFLMAVYSEQR